jgi:hypothetical protein
MTVLLLSMEGYIKTTLPQSGFVQQGAQMDSVTSSLRYLA